MKTGGFLDSISWAEIEFEVYNMDDAEAYHYMYPLLQPAIDVTDSLYDIDLTEDFASNDYSIVQCAVVAEQTFELVDNFLLQDTTSTSVLGPNSYPSGNPDLEKILYCLVDSFIGVPMGLTVGGYVTWQVALAGGKKVGSL